jgi:hypothetical protein
VVHGSEHTLSSIEEMLDNSWHLVSAWAMYLSARERGSFVFARKRNYYLIRVFEHGPGITNLKRSWTNSLNQNPRALRLVVFAIKNSITKVETVLSSLVKLCLRWARVSVPLALMNWH